MTSGNGVSRAVYIATGCLETACTAEPFLAPNQPHIISTLFTACHGSYLVHVNLEMQLAVCSTQRVVLLMLKHHLLAERYR